MKCVRFAFLTLAVLLLAVGAYAQATGSIEGRITDEHKAPLPGVTVTVTGGGLAEPKVATSDSEGRFRIDGIPPGSYVLKFTLENFATQEQTNVAVSAGRSISVQAMMRSAFKEEVTVTGSLVPRPTLEAMSPVTTMDVEELSYQGATRLEDLLTSLPQIFTAQNSTVSNGSSGTATVSLRNLGPGRTLVLVDGKRLPIGDTGAISADLNFIPAALVKRVDVLTGGASSVYGADAVAGVVNFVLDRDFEGMKAGIEGGGYEHNNDDKFMEGKNAARGFKAPTGQAWDGGQFDAYAAFGGKFADGRGHATMYLDYRKQAPLLKNRRDYTNCSVSSLGPTATGVRCGGSGTAATGQFLTDDGGDYTVTGSNFTDFGPANLFNYAVYNYMQRPDERYAGGGFLTYEWSEHAQAYVDVMLMQDRTDAQIAPSGDFGNTLYINCDNPMLSADQYQKICTNGGYGPGIMGPDGVVGDAGLQILRRNVEGGGRTDLLTHQSFRLVGGIKGEINKNWTYDVYGLHAETRIPETYINDMNTLNLQNALFVTGTPGDPSTWQCRDATARAAGCVPWNIFTNGGVTRAAVNYLLLPLVSEGDVRTQLVSGKLTADLKDYGIAFPSAAEGISLALGAEYHKEYLNRQTDLAYQQGWGAGQGSVQLPVVGGYTVKEMFIEAAVPIVQGVAGAQNLSLSLGYRYSDYNLTGSHPSYKVEATWAPSSALKIRGGVNRAVRSPNVVELFTQRGIVLGGSTDPCSGTTPDFTQAQCAHLGISASQYGHIIPNPAGQYNTIQGGNPALNPEKADTQTAGIVFTPSGVSSLTAAIDYYDIKITDTIGALNADDILTQCGLTGNASLCALVHRDQFGSLWRTPNGYTISSNSNIGKKRSQGIDANISYTIPTKSSFFSFGLIGTYLMKSEIDTGLFSYDCVGWYGNKCNDPYSDHTAMQPKWRHLFRFSWDSGALVLTAAWRMIGSMTAEEASSQSALANPGKIAQIKANRAYKYPAYQYFDLAASYKLKKGVQFTLGINNIADKEPPLGAGNSANDYADGFYGTYDSYGRYVHSSIQFTF